jgi:hypothetical protein
VLSHHVDDFALVSAFFLFALGCLNILIGLIWRESAKSKRSLTFWRDQGKSESVLPTHVGGVNVRPVMQSKPPSFLSSVNGEEKQQGSENGSSRAGFGFGRQGEKAAGLNGKWML